MKKWLLSLILACSTISTLFGANSYQEKDFVRAVSESKLMKAQNKKDFISAAHSYERLIALKNYDGQSFYNLGCAYLKIGKYNDAINAFERAERYLGDDEDLIQNYTIALTKLHNNPDVSLPWEHYLAFWHYSISYSTRLNIFIFIYVLFWILLLIKYFKNTMFLNQLLISLMIMGTIFGTSVLITFIQEHNDRKEDIVLSHEFGFEK